MQRITFSRKLLIFVTTLIVLVMFHHFIFRPALLEWGAPESIRNLVLPGDSLAGEERHTRAVLIEATPQEIWPWLMQLGQDRGGFYSYQWLENLFRADIKNVYQIKDEFQLPRAVGDTVWLATKEHYNGRGYQIVAQIIPSRSFVMVGGEDYTRIKRGDKGWGSWAFYLRPENETHTWLIVRSSESDSPFGNTVLRYFTFEVPHFIMERKMLKNIKKLAG